MPLQKKTLVFKKDRPLFIYIYDIPFKSFYVVPRDNGFTFK